VKAAQTEQDLSAFNDHCPFPAKAPRGHLLKYEQTPIFSTAGLLDFRDSSPPAPGQPGEIDAQEVDFSMRTRRLTL
jgi:hypothetical protein